jgi:transposase InsO family protein
MSGKYRSIYLTRSVRRASGLVQTLKCEEIYANRYRDFEDLQRRVEEFIEQYYNVCRLHSALGYSSPEKFEKESQMDSERPSGAAIMTFVGA